MREPQLLRRGWPKERAVEQRMSHGLELVAEGWTFRKANGFQEQAKDILGRWVTNGADFPKHHGGIVAFDDQQVARAAARVSGFTSDEHGLVVTVHAVAVEPDYRKRGLGLVLLGMVPEIAKKHGDLRVAATMGACAPETARFYQQAGFDVLRPGERLPLGPIDIKNPNVNYPCYFFRAW